MNKTIVSTLLAIVFFVPTIVAEEFALQPNDRIVLLGGTLAERLQYDGWLESIVQKARPGLQVKFRNLGWSGDEVSLMPRPMEFESLEETLAAQKATAAFLFFGANESFRGKDGEEMFRETMHAFIERLRKAGISRMVLFSPTAAEPMPEPFPNVTERNQRLERYGQIVAEVAAKEKLTFVDLFEPMRSLMAENRQLSKTNSGHSGYTINGIHFNEAGNQVLAKIIANGIGISDPITVSEDLRKLVVEKNRQFFYRWRPSNAEYIFGRRKEPYGVLSFPPEMKQLEDIVEDLDQQIHRAAATSEP